MNKIEIIDSGYVSRDDSAFPTLAILDNGEIVCGYTARGKGPDALGGTDWSKSSDQGASWTYGGVILPRKEDPVLVSSLRLSVSSDGTLLAYGSRDKIKGIGDSRTFGEDTNEPVLCRSGDDGKTWSDPEVLPNNLSRIYEISNPIIDAGNNIWLAPAATLSDGDKLGERVVVFRSEDKGNFWPEYSTVFYDPEGKKGFFEQKIINLGQGRLFAVAWTVIMGEYRDLENHYSFSNDFGVTWLPAKPIGIKGQTLSPLLIDENRFLFLSNRRYGNQGVVAYFARYHQGDWIIEGDSILWDAQSDRNTESEKTKGIEAFDDFAFGLPSAIQLGGNLYLSVHWCREDGIFGIRWTRFKEDR